MNASNAALCRMVPKRPAARAPVSLPFGQARRCKWCPILSLVIPIFVSAAIVFVVSSIIHMLLPFHRNDFRKLPKEDEVMDALRGFNVPPGDYAVPCAGCARSHEESGVSGEDEEGSRRSS